MTCTAGGATLTITIPGGDFTSPIQIVVSTGVPSQIGSAGVPGYSAVLAIEISIVQGGAKYTGTLATPANVNVSDAIISSADKLVEFSQSSQSFNSVLSASLGSGSAMFTIDSDPAFAILAANPVQSTTTTAPSVQGATGATTGKPFILEGTVGGLLVVAGVGALLVNRRRRSAR